jgi:hypothetical protein
MIKLLQAIIQLSEAAKCAVQTWLIDDVAHGRDIGSPAFGITKFISSAPRIILLSVD